MCSRSAMPSRRWWPRSGPTNGGCNYRCGRWNGSASANGSKRCCGSRRKNPASPSAILPVRCYSRRWPRQASNPQLQRRRIATERKKSPRDRKPGGLHERGDRGMITAVVCFQAVIPSPKGEAISYTDPFPGTYGRRVGSGLASLHDSAGRPNQRLAFRGPPRTRPDDSLRWIRCWFVRLIGANRPGSDTGADDTPSARRVGAPPGLRRCARLRPSASPRRTWGVVYENRGPRAVIASPKGEAISRSELNDYATV